MDKGILVKIWDVSGPNGGRYFQVWERGGMGGYRSRRYDDQQLDDLLRDMETVYREYLSGQRFGNQSLRGSVGRPSRKSVIENSVRDMVRSQFEAGVAVEDIRAQFRVGSEERAVADELLGRF